MVKLTPYLTKSKYVAGLQCSLRLWKQVYAPLPYREPVRGSPEYEGTQIGKLARNCFPNGVLVDNEVYDHCGAIERTKSLLAEGCPAIFEGTFEFDNRRIRVDILKNLGEGRWALYEVKSSTSIHPEHRQDAAFQADVLRQCGIKLDSVSICHVDNDYRLGVNGLDITKFFRFVDITQDLHAQCEELVSDLEIMAATLGAAESPKVSPGLHCWKPYACEFLDQCAASLPKDWIGNLPRINQAQIDEMSALGVSSMAEIPDTLKLRGVQETVRAAHGAGVPFISSELQYLLRPLAPPAFYLDFESLMPGIPLYAETETAPYQHIPFLFSLHRTEDEALHHSDYIAPPGDDPRRAFAVELIRQTSLGEGAIIVYSAYEKRIINELARALPDLAVDLKKIIDRLQDLLAIVRKAVYLPAFNGSFSIKDVGPALAADVSYADLDIKNGSTAAAVYQQLVEEGSKTNEVLRSLSSLRAYCKRDTLAMVRVHQALTAFANSNREAGN